MWPICCKHRFVRSRCRIHGYVAAPLILQQQESRSWSISVRAADSRHTPLTNQGMTSIGVGHLAFGLWEGRDSILHFIWSFSKILMGTINLAKKMLILFAKSLLDEESSKKRTRKVKQYCTRGLFVPSPFTTLSVRIPLSGAFGGEKKMFSYIGTEHYILSHSWLAIL